MNNARPQNSEEFQGPHVLTDDLPMRHYGVHTDLLGATHIVQRVGAWYLKENRVELHYLCGGETMLATGSHWHLEYGNVTCKGCCRDD